MNCLCEGMVVNSAELFLSELQQLDVALSVTNGNLHCDAPKGVLTPVLRDRIKQHKPALLRLLTNRRDTATRERAKTLPSISRDGELPLSYSQERIWLLSKLDPDHHVTGNLHFAFRIAGPLDVPALEKTLNAIIERHEVFRVRCETIDNRPVQFVSAPIAFTLAVRDIRGLPAHDKAAVVTATAEQYALAPFDLAQAPILRTELLRTENDEHVFLLATHLYVFDGWSTAILFKALSRLYAAFHTGELAPLPPLTAQYADFAHWHRNWFEGDEASKQSHYWKEKLQDAQLVTGLPLDRPRPLTTVSESAHVDFTLPDVLAEAIRNLSQQAGSTLFIGLLAAFQTLLYCYTRQTHIATGTIVSNRRLAEAELMIGSFANNILIASDFHAGMIFKDLADQLSKASREAYAHQDLPFERLLGELNPNLNHHPLFRVMFVLHQHQSIQHTGLEFAGLTVQKLPDVKARSRYDLELVMVDRNSSLSGLFEYNADIFDRVTIEDLKDNFLLVLNKITDNPDLSLAELPSFLKRQQPQDATTPNQTGRHTVLRTPLEARVAKIWQDVFGIEGIGAHDRFSDLGGHSLLAVKLVAALQEEFNKDIKPVSMFEFPTVAELANFIASSEVS